MSRLSSILLPPVTRFDTRGLAAAQPVPPSNTGTSNKNQYNAATTIWPRARTNRIFFITHISGDNAYCRQPIRVAEQPPLNFHENETAIRERHPTNYRSNYTIRDAGRTTPSSVSSTFGRSEPNGRHVGRGAGEPKEGPPRRPAGNKRDGILFTA